MRPFTIAWIGVLVVTFAAVPLLAQSELRGDFSAQGPGSTGRAVVKERPEIVFSKDASDAAEDDRPSLPGGLRSLGEAVESTPVTAQQPPLARPSTVGGQPRSGQTPDQTVPKHSPTSRPSSPRLALGSPTSESAKHSDKPLDWLSLKAHRSISSMLGGLSIAIGLFFLLAWTVRKRMPKGAARLPDEIIEVLGRTTLAPKQSLHLVRVGGKLIVVSVTAAGTETLTEVTDPGEVTRILAACQRQSAHSSSADFRQVFEQLGREPASGFLET